MRSDRDALSHSLPDYRHTSCIHSLIGRVYTNEYSCTMTSLLSCQKAKARPEPRLQAVEIYSHAAASASYFIYALIRTPSTLFSTTSVSSGIGTTWSIFIVELGPKHFLRCDNTNNKVQATVAYTGHCSQCS